MRAAQNISTSTIYLNSFESPSLLILTSKKTFFKDTSNGSCRAIAKAKNLGIVMDKTLFFNDHINETCKKASFVHKIHWTHP